MVVEYERTDNVATRCEVLGYVACSFVNGTCRVVSDTFGAIHINLLLSGKKGNGIIIHPEALLNQASGLFSKK